MTHKATFGRAVAKDTGARPIRLGGGESETISRASAEPSDRRLRSNRTAFLLAGDLIGFCGLLVVFAATVLWPADPAALSALGSEINIPPVLTDVVQRFTELSRQNVNVAEVPLGWYCLAFLVVGVMAALNRRWLLVGLTTGFMFFPFSAIGIIVPVVPLLAAAFAAATVFAIAGGRIAKLAMLPIIGVVYVFCLYIAVNLVPDGSARLSYRSIPFAELMTVDGRTLEGKLGFGGGGEAEAARAFAMAQQHALRGEPDAAAKSIATAMSGGYPNNLYEARILGSIEDYITISGARGDTASAARWGRYWTDTVFAWLALVLGSVLAMAAPFSEIISTAMSARLERISRYRAELTGGQTPQPGHDLAPVASHLHSLAVDDARQAMEAITRRLHRYRVALIASFWLCLCCGLRAYELHLPAPGQNTAFDTIGLEGPVVYLAQEMGLAVKGSPHGGSLLGAFWSPASLLFIAPAVGLLFRAYRTLSFVALVSIAAIDPGLGAVSGSPVANTLPLESVTDEFRQFLVEVNAEGKDVIRKELAHDSSSSVQNLGPSFPPIDLPGTPKAETSALARMPGGQVPIEDVTAATFVLAQIEYLKNRPEEMVQYLEDGIIPGRLDDRADRQRYALMLDWAKDRGVNIGSDVQKIEPLSLPSVTRVRGRLLLAISITAGMASVLSLLFMLIASRRGKRIDALVAQRSSAV